MHCNAARCRGDFREYAEIKGLKEVFLTVPDFVRNLADRIQRAGRNETLLFLATDGTASEVKQFKMLLASEYLTLVNSFMELRHYTAPYKL